MTIHQFVLKEHDTFCTLILSPPFQSSLALLCLACLCHRRSRAKCFVVSDKFELPDRILPKQKIVGHRCSIFWQMISLMTMMQVNICIHYLIYFCDLQWNYTYKTNMRIIGSTKFAGDLTWLKFPSQFSKAYIFYLYACFSPYKTHLSTVNIYTSVDLRDSTTTTRKK